MRLTRPAKWALGVLPLGIFFAVFFLLPQVYFLRAAFYTTDTFGQISSEPTTETLARAFDGFYLGALWQTVELCLLTSVLTMLLAYPMAYTIVRSRKWGGIVFVAVVAAMFSSAVARVLGWQVLLAVNGPINDLIQALGRDEPLRLTNNLTGVVIGSVHAVLPVAVLGLMPVCEMVREEQSQAAMSLGASPWRSFSRVFLPQTRTGVISVGLLLFAVTAGAFTTPALLGGGRVAVLSVLIYTLASQSLDYSTAAVLSLLLLVVVGLAVLAGLAVGRRGPRTSVTSI
jgi:ABC-type spermidine/putrescine transport system permease subunit I